MLEDSRVFGELTCPMAVEEDQGAYSCEAINSMGSCFAGSAGCGQPGQDAILVVNTGGGVCPRASFNSLALSAEQCIPCHCFGHTDSCKSSDLFVSVLPPPGGVYTLVSVSLPGYSPPVLGPSIASSGVRLSPTRDGHKLFVPLVSQLKISGILYFALPQSHAGNLLKSYGAHLRFSVRYPSQENGGSEVQGPAIILKVTSQLMAMTCTNVRI